MDKKRYGWDWKVEAKGAGNWGETKKWTTNEGEVFLESKRYENKEMVHQTVSKVCYTNFNGLMSTKMELNELLNRTTPDVVILCETK